MQEGEKSASQTDLSRFEPASVKNSCPDSPIAPGHAHAIGDRLQHGHRPPQEVFVVVWCVFDLVSEDPAMAALIYDSLDSSLCLVLVRPITNIIRLLKDQTSCVDRA